MRKTISRLAVLGCIAVPLVILYRSSIETDRGVVVGTAALDFGEVAAANVTEQHLSLHNPNHYAVEVNLVADCSCITLSAQRVTIEPRRDTVVVVKLNRLQGDRREGLYTFLDSEIEIGTLTAAGVMGTSIPVSATFYEPYAVDQRACTVAGLPWELQDLRIPLGVAADGVAQPSVASDQLPDFIKSVGVAWNDDFSAGELIVAVRQNTPPGHKTGIITLNVGQVAGGQTDTTQPSGQFSIPLAVQVKPPYRLHPTVVMLGGWTETDSETVSLHPVAEVACAIVSTDVSHPTLELSQSGDRSVTVHRAGATAVDGASPYLTLNVQYEYQGTIFDRSESIPIHLSN